MERLGIVGLFVQSLLTYSIMIPYKVSFQSSITLTKYIHYPCLSSMAAHDRVEKLKILPLPSLDKGNFGCLVVRNAWNQSANVLTANFDFIRSVDLRIVKPLGGIRVEFVWVVHRVIQCGLHQPHSCRIGGRWWRIDPKL